MALGNNLKKKNLIPSEEEKEKKPAQKKGKVAAKKKTTGKPTASKKPAVSKKTAVKKKPIAKKKTLISKPKPKTVRRKIETVQEEPIQEVTKQEVEPVSEPPVVSEEVQASQEVELPAPKETRLEEKPASYNPIIPYYIAQELHVKKTELRKRYKEQINALKGKSVHFVVFEVGGEFYAIDIDVIKEVVPIPHLSKTPNTPAHIKGIANVRGSTYTVFDLAIKFKVIGGEVSRYLLIIDSKKVEASITLSTLPTTLRTKGDNISSSLNLIEDASLDVSFIRGLIQHDDKLIYYLDIIELLSNDKAIVIPDNLMKEGA